MVKGSCEKQTPQFLSRFLNTLRGTSKGVNKWPCYLQNWLVDHTPYAPSTEDTLRPILKRAAWSMNLALRGERPSPELAQQAGFQLGPLARKSPQKLSMTFALTEVKGDWQWIVYTWETWGHYWKCGAICHRCSASRLARHLLGEEIN